MQEDKELMLEREFEFRNKENQTTEKNGKNEDGRIHEEIYNSYKYISVAKRVQNGTVPINILEFQYPFMFLSFLFNDQGDDSKTLFSVSIILQ